MSAEHCVLTARAVHQSFCMDYSLINRSNVQWYCYKCEILSLFSFTCRRYEISPISGYNLSADSFNGPSGHSVQPVLSLTPKHPAPTSEGRNQNRIPVRSKTKKDKRNLWILNISCSSICDKTAEFAAILDYMKPDLVCGTESWLRGIKPGRAATHNAIKSMRSFQQAILHLEMPEAHWKEVCLYYHMKTSFRSNYLMTHHQIPEMLK